MKHMIAPAALATVGFLLIAPVALATVGVDSSSLISESQWTCLQTPGGQGPIQFAITPQA